jgi:hypothetical protein
VTLNREVFRTDPLSIPKIPNDGVTTIGIPASEEEWDILQYELGNFVCKGEYERGLERILSSYLANLGEDRQPAVWVSGFYGSGKSHFVRVLEAVWCDFRFPSGESARNVVRSLSTAIDADLRELSTEGKRKGGLWAAAGTLGAGAGGSFRLAFLGVVFSAARLPTTNYAAASFVLWLQKEGLYKRFCERLTQEKRGLDEFAEFLVSPAISQILLELMPDFASDVRSAKSLLKAQFPTVNDVSDDEMLRVLGDVLELQTSGSARGVPCTLVVLDELQQFIGDDNQRLTSVQSIVEAVTQKFGSRLLFVATGQSALQASPVLAKLQDRFTVRVQLSDVDVETVVREVVLQKRPDKVAELATLLDQVSGEISRHLQGTAIEAEGADKESLVLDYPLLPTRRRFWERTLRVIDRGTAGQLRSQLRVTFDAVRQVGDKPTGDVVAADTLFEQKRTDMLNSGVLLREVDHIIQGQRDGTEDGLLRSRLLALIFLISRLPDEVGVNATVDVLADLLVTNLPMGSGELRRRIPDVLQPLLNRELMVPDGEYRLQTKESAEWHQAYEQRVTTLKADDGRIAVERMQELRVSVDHVLRGLAVTQGTSRTARKVEITYGEVPPRADGSAIPLWVCDGWSVTEKVVRDVLTDAGTESALVAACIPKRDSDLLKQRLVEYCAATETLATRTVPVTDEGREARRSIESIQATARDRLDNQVRELLVECRVFKAGAIEVTGGDIRERVELAARDAAERLYPLFAEADDQRWGAVVKRAGDGAGDALAALGYRGDAEKHPVCQRVLAFVGGGKRGSEVHKHFEAPRYGWPREAINGALLVLLVNGHLTARQNTVEVTAKQLTLTKIGVTDFRAETVTISAQQRIDLRGLLQRVAIAVNKDEEGEGVVQLIDQLVGLAARAGGDPPLPERPSVDELVQLRSMVGNERLLAVWGERELFERHQVEWRARTELITSRLPRWEQLQRFLAHARSLAVAKEVESEVQAIRVQRQLLDEPDPVPPVVARVTEALREAIGEVTGQFTAEIELARERLMATDTWDQLDDPSRVEILDRYQFNLPKQPDLSTDEALLRVLDEAPLRIWPDRIAAIGARSQQAALAAARAIEPKVKSVTLPSRTLRNANDVDTYVECVRQVLMAQIDDGPLVVG